MPYQHEPIALLPAAAADDRTLITHLTQLINKVYAVAERGLWIEGTARTSTEEMTTLVHAGEIAVARVAGEIAGSIRVRRAPAGNGVPMGHAGDAGDTGDAGDAGDAGDEGGAGGRSDAGDGGDAGDIGEFGMLVTAPAHRGSGIGRALIDFTEHHTRTQGLTTMQLELLVPQTWIHPSKATLHKWYTRLGYTPITTHPLSDSHPHLSPYLATPCDVRVYRKPLGPPGGVPAGTS